VRISLLGALLLLLASALLASLIPAALALDHQVAAELRRTAVEDLGRAPMILKDRNAARAEALSMHAMTVAGTQGLLEAVESGRMDHAADLARDAAAMYGEDPVLIARDGVPFVGPGLDSADMQAVRSGGSGVAYVFADGMPHAVGLVALLRDDTWMGAAGSASVLDATMATALSALARADVTLLGPEGSLVASTLDSTYARSLGAAALSGTGRQENETVREILVGDDPVWVASGELGDAATVVFSRIVSEELAALPGVRRSALLAGLITLGLALGVGTLVAAGLSRPVRGLAQAAARVAEGDFEAPVPHSRLDEVERLGGAFRTMRESLRRRIGELADANRALEDRQRRLADLQAELVRQDRLASSARLVAELAHEIRNPVANVRNCLEVVRRGLADGTEGARFADMAIDEVLRMHELAEHLLDLNRPGDGTVGSCDPVAVAKQVATLAGVGDASMDITVTDEAGGTRVGMPADALKQILFNLVQNAREAAGEGGGSVDVRVKATGGTVRLEVVDGGPGIDPEALTHLFDPFFTTKDAVHGVGLGLYIAEGLTRRYGGRMEAVNRTDATGAVFSLDVPAAEVEP
jgi:signal transduction histidine kinase